VSALLSVIIKQSIEKKFVMLNAVMLCVIMSSCLVSLCLVSNAWCHKCLNAEVSLGVQVSRCLGVLMPSVIMLSVIDTDCNYAVFLINAECRYAECHIPWCHYADRT
jgi:hypothetical protein